MALERALFDDDLGPQARDYIGSDYAQDLAATLVGDARGPRVGLVGRREGRAPAPPPPTSPRGPRHRGLVAAPRPGRPWPGRGAGSTRSRSRSPRWASAASARSSGTSTRRPSRSTAPPARSTTPTTGSGAPTRTRPTRSSRRRTPWRSCSTSPTARRCGPCTTWATSTRADHHDDRPERPAVQPPRGRLGRPWLPNETVPLPFTDPAIDAATAATLVLQPAP